LKTQEERKAAVRDTYMQKLDYCRKKVISFYKLEDDSLVTVRTLLRCYPHSLASKSPVKLKYHEMNSTLDKVENNMCFGIFAEELIDPDNKYYNSNVLNEERDLERLTKFTINLSEY
jgi:hypothetical protein